MTAHRFDDDGICETCDFDGAEWTWWKRNTYEGISSNEAMPKCKQAEEVIGERE